MRPKEAPRHMLLAMGITSFLCIAIGVYPAPLYAILPFEVVDAHPYTMGHVAGQLQLLLFALLAFAFLFRRGIHPPEIRAVNLDTDWTYRKAGPSVIYWLVWAVGSIYTWLVGLLSKTTDRTIKRLYNSHGPEGRMARNWPTGAMVLSIAVLLGATLFVNFLL
jgi:multicomponent Na+:H+ antiporter subunit D